MTKSDWNNIKDEKFKVGNLIVIPNYKKGYRKLSAIVYEDLRLFILQQENTRAKNLISVYKNYFIIKEIR